MSNDARGMATRERGLCRKGFHPERGEKPRVLILRCGLCVRRVKNQTVPSNPPFPINVVTEERSLAAIVFTDAVGYSARVERSEAPALGAMEEDFETMRLFARQANGTVLKSMGDGLLIYFASAVQAVNWALRTQRHFAERTREAGGREAYRHRVGIHVGDVFKKADDVAGDGVNIAARVQGEAPPGGICISQTVYDLVKNKLELHTVRLEPRKLKNIRELIQMYHVLLEAPVRPEFQAAPAPLAPAPERAAPAAAAPRRVLWTVLALAAIGVGVFLLRRGLEQHDADLARSQQEQATLAAAIRGRAGEAAKSAVPAEPAATRPAVEFDFRAMTTAQPASPTGSDDQVRAFRDATQSASELDTWVRRELANYTRNRVLLVRDLRDARTLTAYVDPTGKINLAQTGAFRAQEWSDLSTEMKAALIVSALRYADKPPGAAMRGAEAFAYLHGLPAMAKALTEVRTSAALLSR